MTQGQRLRRRGAGHVLAGPRRLWQRGVRGPVRRRARHRSARRVAGLRPHGAHRRLRPRPHLGRALQPGGDRSGSRRRGGSTPRTSLAVHRRPGRRARSSAAGAALGDRSRAGRASTSTGNFLAANGFGDGGSPGRLQRSPPACLVAEVVLTVVLPDGDPRRSPTAGRRPASRRSASASALTLIHLVTIPVTNTSVNPARSIGPALFTGGRRRSSSSGCSSSRRSPARSSPRSPIASSPARRSRRRRPRSPDQRATSVGGPTEGSATLACRAEAGPAQGVAREGHPRAVRGGRPRRRPRAPTVDYRATIDDPRIDEVRILRPQEIPQLRGRGPVRPRHHRAGLDRGDRQRRRRRSASCTTRRRRPGPVQIVVAVPGDSPCQSVDGPAPGRAGVHRVPRADPPVLREARHRAPTSACPTAPPRPRCPTSSTASSTSPRPAGRCGPPGCGSSTRSSRRYTELIANPAAYADPDKRHAMEQIRTLLQGALEARGKVLVKLNVRRGRPRRGDRAAARR